MSEHPWKKAYNNHRADIINERKLKRNPVIAVLDYILEAHYGDRHEPSGTRMEVEENYTVRHGSI